MKIIFFVLLFALHCTAMQPERDMAEPQYKVKFVYDEESRDSEEIIEPRGCCWCIKTCFSHCCILLKNLFVDTTQAAPAGKAGIALGVARALNDSVNEIQENIEKRKRKRSGI